MFKANKGVSADYISFVNVFIFLFFYIISESIIKNKIISAFLSKNTKPPTNKRKWFIFNLKVVARPGFEPGTSGL
jgi:hypothetical protein